RGQRGQKVYSAHAGSPRLTSLSQLELPARKTRQMVGWRGPSAELTVSYTLIELHLMDWLREVASMNRRHFLRGAVAGGAAPLATSSAAQPVAPNDRVRVAIIGCGAMGRMDMADFQKQPEVEIVACCDVDRTALEWALREAGGKAASYTDYRK